MCAAARIPSCAKSHDKYTHVWRSTIITIGSEEVGAKGEGEGGLAGNRYIHTRNRVTLPVTPTRRTHVQARLGGVHTRGAAGAHRLTGLHK